MKKIYVLSAILLLSLATSCDSKNNSNSDVSNSSTSELNSTSTNSESSSLNSESSSEVITNEDLLKLQVALQNDYTNLTFKQDVSIVLTINNESNKITMSDVEEITEKGYSVAFTENGNTSNFFVENVEKGVKLYTCDTQGKWTWQFIEQKAWDNVNEDGSGQYIDYYSAIANPNDFAIDLNYFEFVDGVYRCKKEYLDEAGTGIVGSDEYDGIPFSLVEISLANDHVSQVMLSCGIEGYASFDFILNYSNFGTTLLTLPEAEEWKFDLDCIDPTTAVDLNQQQTEKLTAALAKSYNSYTCDYTSSDSTQRNSVLEKTAFQNGKYDVYQEITHFGMFSYQNQYYLEATKNNTFRYYLDDNDIVASSPVSSSEAEEYTPYAMTPKDFPFSAEFFGIVGNTYVCKPVALQAITSASNMTNGTVASIEIKLDKDNNVTSLRILYSFYATTSSAAYTSSESFAYSKIESTAVTLPTVGQPSAHIVTDSDLISFTKATKFDMSNVTMLDNFSTSIFMCDGTTIQNIGIDVDEENQTSQYYMQTFTYESDGKYYVAGDYGQKEEIPAKTTSYTNESGEVVYTYGYDFYVPTINFEVIDTSKLYYDVFSKNYYIDINDVNLEDFIFYFTLGFDEYTFTRIVFDLNDDGSFNSIQLYYSIEEDSEYVGKGLIFSNYGTTKLI